MRSTKLSGEALDRPSSATSATKTHKQGRVVAVFGHGPDGVAGDLSFLEQRDILDEITREKKNATTAVGLYSTRVLERNGITKKRKGVREESEVRPRRAVLN